MFSLVLVLFQHLEYKSGISSKRETFLDTTLYSLAILLHQGKIYMCQCDGKN